MGCVTRGVIINNVALSCIAFDEGGFSISRQSPRRQEIARRTRAPLDLISIWAPVCVGGWFGVRAKNSGSCQRET